MTPPDLPGSAAGASEKSPKPSFSRRTAVGAGAAILGFGAAAASAHALGSQFASDAASHGSVGTVESPLRIGYLPITDAAPLLLAHAQDTFGTYGLHVAEPVRFRSWNSLMEAFIAGRVDVIHLLMPMALYMRYHLNVPAKVLAWNHVNGSALTLHPDYTELGQLAGRTLAIPSWFSIHNVLLQRLLRQAGMAPVIRAEPRAEHREVALLVMAPSDMIPALANRTIAGFTVADPFNSAAYLGATGRIHRYLGDTWRQHACCATVVHESLLGDDERSAALANALADAAVFGRERREDAAKLLAGTYLPQKPKAIAYALTDHGREHAEAVHNPSWGGQLLDFTPFPYPSYTRELVVQMRDTLVDAPSDFLHSLNADAVHADLVDDRFVRRALERLGAGTFGMTGFNRTEELSNG